MTDTRIDYIKEYTYACFDAFCTREKFASATRRKYLLYVKQICNKYEKDFCELKDEDVYHYYNEMTSKMGDGSISKKTTRTRFYSYISFANYLMEIGELTHNSFDIYTLPEVDDAPKGINIPSLDTIECVLENIEDTTDMYLLFLIVLRMGLGVAEICDLKSSDLIKFDDKYYFKFNDGKKDCRYMEIPDDLEKYVLSYHATNPFEYFFHNRTGKKLKEGTLEKRVRNIMAAADCEPFTLRDLRNRAIYQALHDGATVEDVAKYNNLSEIRVNTFANSPFVRSNALSVCPANVSRFKVV